jgi:HSP20 family protein
MPRLIQEFEHLFGDLDGFLPREAVRPALRFSTDETERAYEIVADLPGLTDKDIKLEVLDGQLTMSGARTLPVPEGAQAIRRERGTLEFSNTLRLPNDVDTGAIQATMKDGVLRLSLPKQPETKPRAIPITTH